MFLNDQFTAMITDTSKILLRAASVLSAVCV